MRKRRTDNLIDVDGPGAGPSANQTLDETYYWIPEITGRTPKGSGGPRSDGRMQAGTVSLGGDLSTAQGAEPRDSTAA